MKRVILLFFISLSVGAGLVYWTASYDSYLLISVGHWSLETSVWFAAGVCLTVLLLAWMLWRWSHTLIGGSVRSVSRWFVGSEARAQKRTVKGLISFIEGDWQPALRQLTKSASRSPEPLINYLAAARSAFELGDETEAQRLLSKAEATQATQEGASLAVLLTQARMQLSGKKFEACAATLERARKQSPRHPVVLDMLRQVYQALNDWSALEAILPQLQNLKSASEDDMQQLSQLLYSKLLQQAGQKDFSADSVTAVWNQIPKQWRSNDDLLSLYVDLLMADEQSTEAEQVLRRSLRAHWSDSLVLRYGVLETNDLGRQLLHAEDWLKERPANSALMLTLGRLALRNQLWGKARDYLESSVKIQPSADACAELGRLLANMGEHKAATELYQQGLLLTANPLPHLPQPELSSKRHDNSVQNASAIQ